MASKERMGAADHIRSAVASNETVSASKTQKHKVVLESVTQEKKKLRQVITFNSKPPIGYTFIPAGNPELTTALKEASRKANVPVYTVTTTPHAKVHDLSQQVHRMGYHFSSIVVADVCNEFGIQLSAAGHVIGKSYETFLKGYHKRGARGSEEEGWDQTTLNTKARDAIKDLFPNIPDNDLFQIIKTAFQKGKKRVGTASELPLARRAQLAVVAHIRHCYTPYDKLLRNGGYHDARGVVEKPTLEKLVAWRGDDENGAKVLEDVFREVVVISDDEDSDDDYDPEAPLKELSVEVQPRVADMGQGSLRPDHRRTGSGYQKDGIATSDDDAPPGFQYVPRRSKRSGNERISDRRGVAHHQVWNAARERFRADPHRYAPASSEVFTQPPPTFVPSLSTVNNGNLEPPRILQRVMPQENVVRDRRALLPETIRGADGAIYTRVPSPPRHGSLATPYDPSRPLLPNHLQRVEHSSSMHSLGQFSQELRPTDNDIALPSIEHDSSVPHTPEHRIPNAGKDYTTAGGPTPLRNHNDCNVIDLTNSSERPAKKRRYDEVFHSGAGEQQYGPYLSHKAAYGREQHSRFLERAEIHDIPGRWSMRGKDESGHDYQDAVALREPATFRTAHSYHHSQTSSAQPGPPAYNRDHDHAMLERDHYGQRTPILLPLKQARPLDTHAHGSIPAEVQRTSGLYGSTDPRYFYESSSELRYDELNSGRQRFVPHIEDSGTRPVYGQPIAGSDSIADRDRPPITTNARYDRDDHITTGARLFYEGRDERSDPLPHRMDRLAVGHPLQSFRHEELAHEGAQSRHPGYQERPVYNPRHPNDGYERPPPLLPLQRDMIRGPLQGRH